MIFSETPNMSEVTSEEQMKLVSNSLAVQLLYYEDLLTKKKQLLRCKVIIGLSNYLFQEQNSKMKSNDSKNGNTQRPMLMAPNDPRNARMQSVPQNSGNKFKPRYYLFS